MASRRWLGLGEEFFAGGEARQEGKAASACPHSPDRLNPDAVRRQEWWLMGWDARDQFIESFKETTA